MKMFLRLLFLWVIPIVALATYVIAKKYNITMCDGKKTSGSYFVCLKETWKEWWKL